jgi:hypothetical protein
MGRNNASRFRSLACALLSASVILCLIIAPLCATRCAAQACTPASPDGPSGTCHHSSNHSGTFELSAVTLATPCAADELVFTAPRIEQRAISQKSAVDSTFFSPSAPHLSAFLSPIDADDPSAFASVFSPGPTLAVFPSMSLRI